MKHFFLDTNIWLDWLLIREGNEDAWELITASEENKCKLFTSAITISTVTYILRKEPDSRIILHKLLMVSEIIETKKTAFLQALTSNFKDMEDAYQYFTAISLSNIDAIVTNNGKDFKNSILPILKAKQAIKLL